MLAYMSRLRERSIWNVDLRVFPTGSIGEEELWGEDVLGRGRK